MLNYIWAGLIVFSLLFAIVFDARDLVRDTYRNGEPLGVQITFPNEYDAAARRQNVRVTISGEEYARHFGLKQGVLDAMESITSDGTFIRSQDGIELRFAGGIPLPAPISTIREVTSSEEDGLRAPLANFTTPDNGSARATITFQDVRFIKLQAIVQAAFDMSAVAVNLAIGLIGVIALWMGLLQIAEKSGLLHQIVRFTQPLLRPFFPEIPKDHPAFGMIVLNLTANMLGLGNAATPLGLKAMESLQELNPEKDTATNSMVMLLAMNTASVQLVPPVLLVAVMGLQINQLIFAILITTSISFAVAVIAARVLSRTGTYAATDPMRNTVASTSASADQN